MFEVIGSLIFGVLAVWYLEWLHKRGKISTEVSRKTIHITTGLILVTWPFFVTWQTILIVEFLYILIAAGVRHFMPLDSQHNIGRRSWGEFFYSFGVIITILLGAPRWVFVLAILHLAIGDAMAALIGLRYGKNNSYKILGQKKSIVGTAAFFATSCVLVALTFALAPGYVTHANKALLLLLPLMTTLAENVGVYGTDNLLIPMMVIVMLSA